MRKICVFWVLLQKVEVIGENFFCVPTPAPPASLPTYIYSIFFKFSIKNGEMAELVMAPG